MFSMRLYLYATALSASLLVEALSMGRSHSGSMLQLSAPPSPRHSQSDTYYTEPPNSTRRESMLSIAFITAVPFSLLLPSTSTAANLPENTGADLSRTGSIETLIPIIKMQQSLLAAKTKLFETNDGSSLVSAQECKIILKSLLTAIPREEKAFKRMFDSYSTPVSYKQKFLDQNAFLVYYTKGFDGPGRPNIESGEDGSNNVQTMQYGARNDAWTAVDNLFVELEFNISNEGKERMDDMSNREDLLMFASKALGAISDYLHFAPEADVAEARSRIG